MTLVEEITADYLHAVSGLSDEDIMRSVFCRLAAYALPEGVDPAHPEVVAFVERVRRLQEKPDL